MKGEMGFFGEEFRMGWGKGLSLSPLNKVALRGTIRVGKRRGGGGIRKP